jgi:hypothetical protein
VRGGPRAYLQSINPLCACCAGASFLLAPWLPSFVKVSPVPLVATSADAQEQESRTLAARGVYLSSRRGTSSARSIAVAAASAMTQSRPIKQVGSARFEAQHSNLKQTHSRLSVFKAGPVSTAMSYYRAAVRQAVGLMDGWMDSGADARPEGMDHLDGCTSR